MQTAKRIVFVMVVLVLIGVAAAVVIFQTIPLSNTQQMQFDTIIVLGSPAKPDGTPSPVQRERVLEGVREYRKGIAPRLIMTGGPAHNVQVEAEVMAALAKTQGVPETAILEERRAQDTIQNAYYSVQIMKARGWNSAEVVSSASHLPRASLIFSHFLIRYRMHASRRPPEAGILYEWAAYTDETRKADRIRLFGFRPSRFLQ